MSAALAWALAHPDLVSLVLALLLWALANVAKRNPPATRSGWRWWLWWLGEHLMVLPWDTWFGAFKLPFRVHPALDKLQTLRSEPDDPEPPAVEPPPPGAPGGPP